MDSTVLHSFNWQSDDLPAEFEHFKEYTELLFDGPLEKLTPQKQLTYVKIWLGREGLKIFKSWNVPTADKSLPAFWKRLGEVIQPRSNFRLARFHLPRIIQNEEENIDAYMSRLRLHVDKCAYGDSISVDDRIIECLISGIKHPKIRESLLQADSDLTLEKAINTTRTHESTLKDLSDFREQPSALINYVRGKHSSPSDQRAHTSEARRDDVTTSVCGNCGRHHEKGRENCPAATSICRQCSKIGHWKAMCRQARTPRNANDRQRNNRGNVYSMRTGDHDTQSASSHAGDTQPPTTAEFNALHFSSVRAVDAVSQGNHVRAFADVELVSLPNSTLHGKVDTGAEISIMPKRIFDKIAGYCPTPSPSSTKLIAYDDGEMENLGTVTLKLRFKGVTADAQFCVVDTSGNLLLGYGACRDLRIVKLHTAVIHQVGA